MEYPEMLGRAVVAKLNDGGGEVHVRLTGADERLEAKRLQEYLADTIEPTPSTDEVRVEPRSGELFILVQPRLEHRPYAHLWEGGRFFVIQDGEQMRPMRREEVLDRAPRQDAVELLLVEEQGGTKAPGTLDNSFWMRIEPSETLSLKLNTLLDSDLLIDPRLTGNRRVGFNFTAAYVLGKKEPEIVTEGKEKRGLRVGRPDIFELTIYENGGLRLVAPLESFSAAAATPADLWPLLWPDDLLEMPISVFRLLEEVYLRPELWNSPVPAETKLLAHLALYDLLGWHLRPGSPNRWRYVAPVAETFKERDFVLEKPLLFHLEELREPDNCGFRLVRRLYEAFGLPESAIPEEFDRKARRLFLSE